MTTFSVGSRGNLLPNQLQIDFAVTYESPALTPPRPINELTKHYWLTDFERTAKQLTSASTCPWTSYGLPPIADRTNFKLSSDHIQTKFDLTWTRLLTRNYLRTVIGKTSNLVQKSVERTSNGRRTHWENIENNLRRNIVKNLSKQRIKDTQDTT